MRPLKKLKMSCDTKHSFHFPISFLFHFFHRATATSWICCNHDLELDFISAWPGWDMEIRAPPQNQEASMDAPWWVSQLKTYCLHLAVLQSLPRLAVITGQSNEGMAGMADIGWFCKSIGSMRKEHLCPRSKSEARSNDPPDLGTETTETDLQKMDKMDWLDTLVTELCCTFVHYKINTSSLGLGPLSRKLLPAL